MHMQRFDLVEVITYDFLEDHIGFLNILAWA